MKILDKKKYYVKYTDDAIWNKNLENGFDVYNTQEFKKKSDYKYFLKHWCDNQEYTGATISEYGKIKHVKYWGIVSNNCVHDEFWSIKTFYIPNKKHRRFWIKSQKRHEKEYKKREKEYKKNI
jgi:hypothetical protein